MVEKSQKIDERKNWKKLKEKWKRKTKCWKNRGTNSRIIEKISHSFKAKICGQKKEKT